MDERQVLRNVRTAIQQGDKEEAKSQLIRLLEEHPGNETGWMWLSALVGDPDLERECLEKVLDINPGNQLAQQHLAKLGAAAAPSSMYVQSSPPLASGDSQAKDPSTAPRKKVSWLNKAFGLVIGLGLFAWISSLGWNTYQTDLAYQAEGTVISATATNYSAEKNLRTGLTKYTIDYRFTVKGKTYRGQDAFVNKNPANKVYRAKQVYVEYLASDPDTNRLRINAPQSPVWVSLAIACAIGSVGGGFFVAVGFFPEVMDKYWNVYSRGTRRRRR